MQTNVYRYENKRPYVAPVDQYLSSKKDYSNRGYVIESEFESFHGFSFRKTLPLAEYESPETINPNRDAFGTGGSSGTGQTGMRYLYSGQFSS